MCAGLFDADEQARYTLAAGRLGYVQIARGSLELNGEQLQVGDGAMLQDEPLIELRNGRGAEVLLFDLPAD